MKRLYTRLIALALIISMNACNKEASSTTNDLMYNMVVNKIWYLAYSITGTSTQSFVEKSTYSIAYLKDGTTMDSDGLIGTYTIAHINEVYQLQVSVKTLNGNAINYTHIIESVDDANLVLSFTAIGQTAKTTLYFTRK